MFDLKDARPRPVPALGGSVRTRRQTVGAAASVAVVVVGVSMLALVPLGGSPAASSRHTFQRTVPAQLAPGVAYPPLTRKLIDAFNRLYRGIYHVTISSASVPERQLTAARQVVMKAISFCNEGAGTRVVAVGKVVSASLESPAFPLPPIFAVFVDPPGNHLVYSPGGDIGGSAPFTANWYAAFFSSPTQPFCTVGYSPRLAALPSR